MDQGTISEASSEGEGSTIACHDATAAQPAIKVPLVVDLDRNIDQIGSPRRIFF